MRIFSYKMTHDKGFAPNPFHGILTLSTCKPGMRATKKVGDWIAGFSSSVLRNNAKSFGVDINQNALIYIAKVSEIVPLQNYYGDARFRAKIPPREQTDNQIISSGDNIYKPSRATADGIFSFEQVSQIHHNDDNMVSDLSGKNALVCEEFYYLGRAGKPLPDGAIISRPKGPTRYGYKTEDEGSILNIIYWVKANFKPGFNDFPCLFTIEEQKRGGKC